MLLRAFLTSLFICFYTLPCAGETAPQNPHGFSEIWGYLYKKEERFLTPNKTLTDIAYFGAAINEIGELENIPKIQDIPTALRQNRRIHLVVHSPGNRSLMYWCLRKDASTKKEIIEGIVRASGPFDGVQIDFETIRPDDRMAFWEFLKDLKKELPSDKILSVCVLPRWKETQDAFNYPKLAPLVDKIIVMAYDQHYRTSAPGCLASVDWCKKITAYAKETLPAQKLVMGIGLYGRVWQNQERAKTYSYPRILDLWKEFVPQVNRESDDTPHFSFKESVQYTAYYEDPKSLKRKLSFYEASGIKSIALWRLGQEPAALWTLLATERTP